MKILGFHIQDNIIANSDGEVKLEPPYLDWILKRSEPNTIMCFYHLDWDTAQLMTLIGLTKNQGRKLLDKSELYIAPYNLRYIPRRFLAMDRGFGKGHPFANFSNMAQYGDFRLSNDTNPVECAKEASRVGQEVYDALTSLGLHPKSLVSPIRPYEKEVLSKMDLPTVDDIPDEAGEFAYNCIKGAWTECFKRGYFPQTWDYDVNSSYAYWLSQMPDLRQGTWHHGKTPIDAMLGYCRAKICMTANFHPIQYEPEGNGEDRPLNYTPTGEWETFLTFNQIRFIARHQLGSLEILDGHWWTPKGGVSYPLKEIITELWCEKEKATGTKREVIKRVAAGLWGKLTEVLQYEEESMGPLFNPVWACEPEVNTQLQVAQFCIENNVVPTHIAVDGILSDRILPAHNDKMGAWKLTHTGPAIVVGSGTVAIGGKLGKGDFTLDYDWIMSQMQKYPDESIFKMKKLSPVTLAKALAQDKWEKLGVLEEIEKTVDVCWEGKRMYKNLGTCAREFMESQEESLPWDTSVIGGLKK